MSTTEETRAKIRPLVVGIVAALGMPWRVEERGDTNGLIITDGEVSLLARTSYVSNGKRLHVTRSLPAGWIDIYGIPAGTESTISLERDPKAAARQLTKLIEITREQTAIVVAEVAKDNNALAMRRDFLESLPGVQRAADWDRRAAKANDARIRIGDVYGDLRVRYEGDGGQLDLNGLSADQVRTILEFVKNGHAKA